MRTYDGIPAARMEAIFAGMDRVRAGLLGDICLDVYWEADMRRAELSRETPHHPLPIVRERMSPGGGGNVAANLAALAPASVCLLSALGEDWRGRELLRLLAGLSLDVSGIVSDGALVTNAYIKPMRHGLSDVVYEDPRLDFAAYEPLPCTAEDALLDALDRLAPTLDVLCVSDQMPCGVVTPRVRARVNALARQGLRVVVDSRDRIGLYTHVTLKPNELEGAKAAGLDAHALRGVTEFAAAAEKLAAQNTASIFMTLGAQGAVYADGGETWHIPARRVPPPIDFCGAGDSSLAGFALALAAGAQPHEAAAFAGLCSEVTIQQIGTTGTATRGQVRAWWGR